MVTDFYPRSHHPLSWLVYAFSHLFIFWGRAQITSSYHDFMLPGFAGWRTHKGLLRELTRITVLKPAPTKQMLALLSVCPVPRHSPPLGETDSVLVSSHMSMRRRKCLTANHHGPGLFVSLSQNISRVEKRNKDDWQAGAESHQQPRWQPGDVRTRLMWGPVTADWQPRTGIQRRWNLPRTSDTLFIWYSRALPP